MKTLQQLGTDIGALVEVKNAAYGDRFRVSGDALRLLYPDGIAADQLDDALLLARIWDKMKRIATDRDALGESPFQDIAGYGILGVDLHQHKKVKAPTWRGSASDPNASSSSKAQPDSAASLIKTKTTATADAPSEPVPLPQLASSSPHPDSAPASTATEDASPDEAAARRSRRIDLAHTYSHWLLRHNNLKCIACSSSVMGMVKLEIPIRAGLGVIRLFTCSQGCWDFCYLQLNDGLVKGATL